uniref:Vesicle tethering protein Uso1/P115-like head domain-containing protein n=1 Tax=Anopheles maculatus TaxID=74869 RepID=A0A182T371_9DIPT
MSSERPYGMSHIVEFNSHIQSYFISSTYGNETLVNQCLEQLAAASTDHKTFDVSVYECNIFFVNLHKLLSHSMKKTKLLWSVVAVLEIAVTDDETRIALVDKFRFLPVISLLLLEVHTPEQQKRVLSLLHHLSYGATIDGQELFIDRLIQKLLNIIEQNHEKQERCEVAQLALSILVNLCHRDLSTTFVLTRNTNISGFCKQIKKFGLLACKMYIILEQNDYIKEVDLHYLLRMSFEEVRLMLASKNSFSLRHVVDFLRYVRTLSSSREGEPAKAAVTDEYFKRDLKKFLLEIATYWAERSPSPEGEPSGRRKRTKGKVELRKDRTNDGLFEILECIVLLKPDDQELYRKISEFGPVELINNARDDCSKAVDLLRTIVEKNPSDTAFAEECKTVLPRLMTTITNNDDERLAIAFAKLLSTIGKTLITLDDPMNEVAEQFFQHLFGIVLSNTRDFGSFDYSLADGHVRMYLWALHTFSELANLCPTHWYAKLMNLLKQKPIQFLIAKGLTGGADVELLEALLQVVASTDFPKQDVARMINMLKSNLPALGGNSRGPPFTPENDNVQHTQPPTGYTFIRTLSRDLQERIDQAVVHIQDAKAAGLINEVEKSELVEFYTHKINMQSSLMNDLRSSLEATTSQITTLTHQNQLLMAEIEKNQKKSLPLLLKETA